MCVRGTDLPYYRLAVAYWSDESRMCFRGTDGTSKTFFRDKDFDTLEISCC